MHKLIALYETPPNPEQFRQHYVQVHVPLLRAMPGIVRMNYSFDIRDATGGPSFFGIFEAYFDKAEDMAAGLQTPEGAAVLADLVNLEAGTHWIFNYPVEEVA